MTGSAVKALRTRLGLEPFAFAAVLGVHVSSVYRWETAESPHIDPLQREILLGLAERKISKAEGADLGKAVRDALVAGGNLRGLAVLLNYITKEPTNG